jgi:xanthine dehydrogenase accessory factor
VFSGAFQTCRLKVAYFRLKHLVFQALAAAAGKNEPVALGIISSVKGSSPQKIGAKALFYADGRIQGTLGGGCLEAEIQQRAIQALRNDKPETFELLLDHDFGWDDGLICGGKVAGVIIPNAQRVGEDFWNQLVEVKCALRLAVAENFQLKLRPNPSTFPQEASEKKSRYQETVVPPCALWIAGAGHIAQAVAPLAYNLDFTVTVFDDRPALANTHYFPGAIQLRVDAWDRLLAADVPAVPTFGLIVTRGHRHDALVLKDWIQKPFLFIGMIGSARKARTIFEHFLEAKLATPAQLARVSCPVGIKIRSQSVQEIAISIMAQYIDKRAEGLESLNARTSGTNELV